ncbi:MAG: hypothetical protein JXA71_14630, partial [Chitinispirillaceae bacterium]|nr:hypothetical protein [Chitinispirillaceae bacterium]
MNVVFFGSSDFGIPALSCLIRIHRVSAVVSTPPRPRGRGLATAESPVAAFARERGLSPIVTPEDLDDGGFHRVLAGFGADIFVVVAFRILPRAV